MPDSTLGTLDPNIVAPVATSFLDIIKILAESSQIGFLHIMIFLVFVVIVVFIWMEHRDRARTKIIRNDWQDQHMKPHETEKDNFKYLFDQLDKSMKDRFDLLITMLGGKKNG